MGSTLKFPSALRLPDVLASDIRENLLASRTIETLSTWEEQKEVEVIPVTDSLVKGQQFCDTFSISPEQGGKCIIIEVKPKGNQEKRQGACLVPVNKKVNLYGCVKPYFAAKGVSFLRYEETLEATQMEYGSITPVGLPQTWPVLIDQTFVDRNVVIGSGKRSSKLYLPCSLLVKHTGGRIVEGLSL